MFPLYALISSLELNLSVPSVPYHIETNQLICIANQLTGFVYDGEYPSLMG